MAQRNETVSEQFTEYVTVFIGNQLFGLPISRVQDVFVPDRLTRVPLSPPEVAGVLNLRGRIVTAIDMRRRLDLEKRNGNEPLKFPNGACEPKPVNLDARWARIASGVIRLEGQLLVVLDVDRVLDMKQRAVAA
jgi:purine-binding chemotaxis protein CheW